MERTYRVTERQGLRTVGLVFVFAGLLFALIGVSVAVDEPIVESTSSAGERVWVGIVFTTIGTLGAWVGRDLLLRRPWLLQIGANGVVTVHGAFWSTQLPATRILALDWACRTVGLEDEDARMLKIVHAGGTIAVAWFPEVESFIADVRAINPGVRVSGP